MKSNITRIALSISTFIIPLIITLVSSNDDIKSIGWNSIDITTRGWWLIGLNFATLIVALLNYYSKKTVADLQFILTPYFVFDIALPNQPYVVPIYNAGDETAKDIYYTLDIWTCEDEQSLSFYKRIEKRLGDLGGDKTLDHRDHLPNEYLTMITDMHKGILLHIKLFYESTEGKKNLRSLVFWRDVFENKFANFTNNETYNNYLNIVIQK